MLIRTLLTMALLTTAVPAISATNIAINSGFETGALAPWFQDRDFGGTEAWNVTNADARSGTFSATNVGNKEIRQNFTPTAVADITQATFWLKHPTSPGLPAFISLFYSDLTDTGFLVSTSTTDWEQFNVLGNLVAGKTLIGFSVFGYSGGAVPNRTYLDDVEFLTEGAVPEPATWAMMIAGFGLVGAAARRSARTKVTFA